MTPSAESVSLAAVVQYGGMILAALLLVGGLIYILRRAGGVGALAYRGRRRRLGLVETLPLDNRRRLILVRRDDVEHLILLGQPGDVLIEAGRDPLDAVAPAAVEIETRQEPRLSAVEPAPAPVAPSPAPASASSPAPAPAPTATPTPSEP